MTHGPGAEEFGRLAAEHGVVPVWREVLADLETPLSVYAKLSGTGPSFLLESAEHGERWGRYSFVGLDPFLVLRGKDGSVEWEGDPPPSARGASGPLHAIHLATQALHAPLIADLPPLHGGAVGYIGWDAVREIERVPATAEDDLGLPDVLVLFPRHVVGFDHLRQTVTVVTNVVIGDDPARQYDEAVAATDAIIGRLGDATPRGATDPPEPQPVGEFASNVAPGDYERMVERSLEHIAAGDVFQVVPSQRFALETSADPFTIYRMLRVINPSPYLFLFDFGELHVIGSSPEALVRVAGTRAETWPIAGTRPRGRTEQEDRELERDLLDSEKERAEHVMLVDLGRNDLGRVCETGSVSVDELMAVERYSHVMHLVSRVSGTLREGVAPVDVLRATFPAGTVSGAPKVRAMEIIDELEPTRRGVYAGAIGYVDLSGNLDTCIALRTLVLRGGVAYAQAGAGIVADSSPVDEETETRNKAMALLSAVAAASMVSEGVSEFRDFDVSRRVPSSRVRRTAPSPEEGTVGQKKSTGRKAASKKAAPAKKSSTKKAAKRTAKKATKRAAKKSTKKAGKKSAKKSTKRPAKKTAKKAAKRSAKKSTKRPAKKTAKKATKRAAKKATKRSSKRSS